MYAAGGFVLGEVCVLLPVGVCAGILAFMGAGLCYLWRKVKGGRSLLWWILPLFAVLGMGRMYGDRLQIQKTEEVAAQVEGECLWVEGRLTSVKEGERSACLEIRQVVLAGSKGERRYPPVIIYVEPEEIAQKGLRIGMRIRVRGELERFSKPGNPGEFDYSRYYHSLGVEGRVYGEGLEITNWQDSPYFHSVYEIKRRWKERLDTICTSQDKGVFQAVVLGDKGALLEEIRELYQKNGIAHLLAISGLHISMVGLGLYHLLRKGGLGFSASGLAASILTVSYGVLVGGSASVVRAVVMVCFQLWADRQGRSYDMLSAMAAAALLLLLQSPTYLFQSGFQLSFGAVLAIGGATPVLARWLGIKKGWRHTLLVNGVLQAATYPIIAYHFFEYPMYGMCLNLLVIPLMGYVLVSGMAGLFLSGLAPWLGEAAIGTGHYILALYQWLCVGFGRLPGALLIVGRPRMWQLGLYGGMWLGLLAAAGKSESGKKEDGKRGGRKGEDEKRERRKGKRKGLRGGLVALWAAVGFLLLRPLPTSGFSAVFLEVGQGDGVCLRTREAVVLVDGGSSDRKKLGEQVLEPFLKSQGISKVDYAIVSHGDEDHISGLTYLLETEGGIGISHLVLPWLGKEDEACKKLQRLAEAEGTQVHWMKAGDFIQAGEMELRCLYAGEEGKSREKNQQSLLVQASYGLAEVLLTGDMGEAQERAWLEGEGGFWAGEGKARILKAAHHGSKYSSSSEFLRAVRPKLAVVSCGAGNRYGHPSPETIQRFKQEGIAYLLTMESGAVTVKTDGKRRWGYESYR